MKPRPGQLAQDGATTGQVIGWDGTEWTPVDGGTPQWWDDNLTATGGESSITLGNTPLPRSERIWADQTQLFRGTDYTLTGSVVALTSPLGAGDVLHTYYAYASGGVGTAGAFTPFGVPISDPIGLAPLGISPIGV